MSRRRTNSLTRVAVAMMSDPNARHYGYGLLTTTRIRSGTLYPILDRMLSDGWVSDSWEMPDEITAKKPRRYYTMTELGRRELGAIVADLPLSPGLAWSM